MIETNQILAEKRLNYVDKNLNQKRSVNLKTCADIYGHWSAYKRNYKKAPKDGVEFQIDYSDTGLVLDEESRARAPIALALHGAPGSYHDFALLIHHLSQQKVRVIAPNFPEYIATVKTKVLFRHSADEKAAYLRDFLHAINVNKIDLLISHSSAIFPTLLILLNANNEAIERQRRASTNQQVSTACEHNAADASKFERKTKVTTKTALKQALAENNCNNAQVQQLNAKTANNILTRLVEETTIPDATQRQLKSCLLRSRIKEVNGICDDNGDAGADKQVQQYLGNENVLDDDDDDEEAFEDANDELQLDGNNNTATKPFSNQKSSSLTQSGGENNDNVDKRQIKSEQIVIGLEKKRGSEKMISVEAPQLDEQLRLTKPTVKFDVGVSQQVKQQGKKKADRKTDVIVKFHQPIEIKAVALLNPAGHRLPKSMKPTWFKCGSVHVYQHKFGRSLFRKFGPAFLTVVGVPVRVDNMDNVMLSATVMRNSKCQRVSKQLQQLSEMKIPTLLVFSENDKLIEKEIFYEMTQFMKLDPRNFDVFNNDGDIELSQSLMNDWIRVMVFKAGGHYAYSNYARTVNKAISELLEKVRNKTSDYK